MLEEQSIERQRMVKAGFVSQGTSLHAWCKSNGVAPQNAHKALKGDWSGPKAAALVDAIVKASKGRFL